MATLLNEDSHSFSHRQILGHNGMLNHVSKYSIHFNETAIKIEEKKHFIFVI